MDHNAATATAITNQVPQSTTMTSLQNTLHQHNTRNGKIHHQQQQQQQQQQHHTPPSATSYELKHFKRPRNTTNNDTNNTTSTLTTRLRAMSDLEDEGKIDSKQKGILKDLVISGDDELLRAVEQYEKGDRKALDQMVQSGVIRKRGLSSDNMELLDDLDLDYMSMEVGNGGDNVSGSVSASASGAASNLKSQSIAMNKPRRRSFSETSHGFHMSRTSSPVPPSIQQQQQQQQYHQQQQQQQHQQNQQQQQLPYDGVGEIEFNADTLNTSNHNQVTKIRADSILDIQRNRANSLAFGGLLGEESASEEVESVGKWMDRAPIMQELRETREMRKMPLKKRVNGEMLLVNHHHPDAGMNMHMHMNSHQQQQHQESEDDDSDDEEGSEDEEMNVKKKKMTVAERKRVERAAKKAQKEREKLEKKLLKERLKLEKKQREREAREKKSGRKKKDNKKKKSTATAAGASAHDGSMMPHLFMNDAHDGNDDEIKVIVSGTGRPRSLSDPNLSITLDANGLLNIGHPPDWVGAYSPESRKLRIDRFLAKRSHRVWVKKVKYDVRKNFADSRLRVKGRFVKKEDELLMRDLMSLT